MTKRLKTVGKLAPMSHGEWEHLPVGTVRAVLLSDGITVSVVKTAPGKWGIHSRGSIPVEKLWDLPTAPRVHRGDGER